MSKFLLLDNNFIFRCAEHFQTLLTLASDAIRCDQVMMIEHSYLLLAKFIMSSHKWIHVIKFPNLLERSESILDSSPSTIKCYLWNDVSELAIIVHHQHPCCGHVLICADHFFNTEWHHSSIQIHTWCSKMSTKKIILSTTPRMTSTQTCICILWMCIERSWTVKFISVYFWP